MYRFGRFLPWIVLIFAVGLFVGTQFNELRKVDATNRFFLEVMKEGIQSIDLKGSNSESLLEPSILSTLSGIQALSRGDNKQAIEYLTAALQANQRVNLVRGLLGTAYFASGEYTDAISYWQSVKASGILKVKGENALNNNRPEDAVLFLESSLQVDPKQPYVYYLLAHAYYYSGNTTKAISAAKQSIEIDTTRNPGYQITLAWLYSKTGNPKLALEAYEQILSLYPDNQAAQEGFRQMQVLLSGEGK